MGLQDELNSLLAKSREMIPKKTAEIMAGALEELQRANITAHSRRKGDLAPYFELSDASGKRVSSKDLLAKGPVVISFYRGGW